MSAGRAVGGGILAVALLVAPRAQAEDGNEL